MSDRAITPTAGKLHPLTYQGTAIRDRGEMLNLTDMWKASGSDLARKPAEWLRSADAMRFIGFLADSLNVGNSHDKQLVTAGRGRDSSTLAHWQIALAYAKYLSPEFHMWCNTVVRERMEGRPPAGGVVTGMDAQARSVIGGIARAVVTKVLAERMEPVERAVLSISERVSLLTQDPSAQVTTEYRPMLAVLAEMGVAPKGRRALCVRMSRALATWCLREMRQSDVRLSKETGRRLFHVNAIAAWMSAEGNMLVAEHKAKRAGQGVLAFPKRPRSPAPVPVEEAGR